MKNLLFVCFILLLCNNTVSAQYNRDSRMSKLDLYIELGTNIVVSAATLNLEAHLTTSRSGKVHLYARAGFGAAAVYEGSEGLGGLGALTMLTGKGKHHFELSGGVFMGNDKKGSHTGFFALPLFDIGYRIQKPVKGFVFRVKVGTLGFGIGLGYAF